ncbi:unnamed protein product [Clonostachys rosea f. rosea IK726]|uniref:Uncharacterized protein n=1 Tax=Clonostachys rosea f. rosea IK726 TaxID=1349383 RepID=A0ACA9URG5_BIOOC|nr:unnamed protein product [Clonostachys rosea f. rosea IK726]
MIKRNSKNKTLREIINRVFNTFLDSSFFLTLEILEELIPLLDGHHSQSISHTLPSGTLVVANQGGNFLGKVLVLERFNLLPDLLPLRLVPLGHSLVVLLPVIDARPALQEVQVLGALLALLSSALVGDRSQGARGHLPEDELLVESSAQTPVEEAAGVDPLKLVTDDTLGLHASGTIMEISVLGSNLGVDGQQLLLTLSHLLLNLFRLVGVEILVLELLLEVGVGLIQAGNGCQLLVLAVLDTDDTIGLQDTTTGLFISIHLHGVWGDGRNVDEDGLFVLDEGVDNERTVLENLVVHVTLTTRETTPVGKDHQRQLLTIVEVIDSLSSLEGGVGVPNTTSLLADLLDRVGVGRVGRGDVLDRACLNSNDTHGDTTETSTTNHNGTSPAAKSLDERVLVEETALEASIILSLTTNQPANIIRLLLGRGVDDITIPLINDGAQGDGVVALVRYERHPLNNLGDTGEIIIGSHVRDTVAVHDLSATKLQVGGVDFTTEQVVQGRGTCQDNGLTLDLDDTLAETNKGDGEDVIVRSAGGTGNQTRASQTLDTQAILLSNNSDNLESLLTPLGNLLGNNGMLKPSLGLLIQIKVTETSIWLAGIVPCNLEVRHQLLSQAQAGTRVGGEVNARNAKLASEFGALVEEVILLGTERTNLVGNVVGDDNEATSARVLRGTSTENPTNHTARVGSRLTVDLLQVVLVIEDKLGEGEALASLGLLGTQGRLLLDGLGPRVLDSLTEELGEIVNVLGSHKMGLVSLRLQPVLGGVRGGNRHQVHRALVLGTANALEDPFALLRLALGIQVDVDNETRGVGNDNTERVRSAGLGVSADNADFDLSHTESPSTNSEAVQEALQALLNIARVKLEDRREVHEDVVQIGTVVASDLQSIEDIVDDTVSLGYQVLRGRDLVSETTRADDGTGEVSLVGVDSLAKGLVNVDVFVFREYRLDVEFGKAGQFQLEGQRRLHMTNTVVLIVLGTTECVVARIRSVASTDEGQATNATSKQIFLERSNQGVEAVKGLLIIGSLGISDCNVDNS